MLDVLKYIDVVQAGGMIRTKDSFHQQLSRIAPIPVVIVKKTLAHGIRSLEPRKTWVKKVPLHCCIHFNSAWGLQLLGLNIYDTSRLWILFAVLRQALLPAQMHGANYVLSSYAYIHSLQEVAAAVSHHVSPPPSPPTHKGCWPESVK